MVTITATASDNVGVAGVQFKLNGSNLGTEDTTSPFSVSWDTAGVTNGSHILSAVARDAAGNQTTSTTIIVTVSNTATPAPGADADFQARCNAPGVVKCIGFDNTTTDIVRNQNLWPAGNGQFYGALDTAVKASGGGALRFTLPPPPVAGANLAGSWSPSSNNALGQLFGENSTFYVQFRQRFSPEMLSNTWDSSWKTVLFHFNQQTCGSVEITTVNYYLSNRAAMYTDCGARGMYTKLDGQTWTNSTPLLIQQGDFSCQYSVWENCFLFVPNEWLTFYYKIHVGTWDQPNGSIEAWVAREGQPYKKFINVQNFALSCNTDPCSQSPGKTQGYNNLTFTPYMTGLSPNSGRAGVTSYTWYDELIVSTQPIASPAAGTSPSMQAPNAPTNLVLQ
jgi:hypothetical protein